MRIKTNVKVFIVISLIAITMLSYSNSLLKVYAIDTVSSEGVVIAEEVNDTPKTVEPKIIEETITVEKKVEVEKVVSPFKLKDLGVFKVTAYCPCAICCGEWTDSAKTKITSIGAGAYEGVTIAVDPNQIPYGTKLFGEEFGVRIATDCGGAIKGKRLDLYFSSHDKALEFGVKYVHLYAIAD